MTIRIERIYVSPVKSLALTELTHAFLEKPGIAGDRAFFIADADGKLFTQREYGPIVRISARYDVPSDELALAFPDKSVVGGRVALGEPLTTSFWGHAVEGRVTEGDYSEALTDFAGQRIRLVKADQPGTTFDAYPISVCSTASVEALAVAAGSHSVDGRRFRQNIYLSGASPHEEDTWLAGELRVGGALLRVKMRDSRCIITTHSPDSGEVDMDTLKVIASYRTDQPKEVNFGVYCTVAEPGGVRVGDEVRPVA